MAPLSIFAVLAILGAVLWVVALVDALKRPTGQWDAAQQNQIVWVLVILFGSFLGAIIYWVVAKPQLDAVT